MNELSASEFVKTVMGKFTIEPYQVELLENIRLTERYRHGYRVGARRSSKWFITLNYLRACWKMGIPTCLVTSEYEVKQKIEVFYDDFVDALRYVRMK